MQTTEKLKKQTREAQNHHKTCITEKFNSLTVMWQIKHVLLS